MILTMRDKELFKKLQTYGLLTTRQVGELAFPGVRTTTVLRRLRKLERESYVLRLTGLDGYEVAWAATQKSVLYVGDVAFKRHFRRDVLEHDVKLTTLRLALEGKGIARHWTPEHEIRAMVARRHGLKNMRDRVVPDGLMSAEVNGVVESVAIEVELHFKNQSRYFSTFREYQNKSNIWAVWYLVSTPGMGDSLFRIWKKANPYGTHVRLLCSLVDDVLKNPLTAYVYGEGIKKKANEFFSAQSLALGVSREQSRQETKTNTVTTENSENFLAPAS